MQISAMLLEFPPGIPRRSLQRRRNWRWQISKNHRLVRLELFGFEIHRYTADTTREVYGTLPEDGCVNRARGEVTTGGRGMCAIAIIQIDTRISLPHARPRQTNRRY